MCVDCRVEGDNRQGQNGSCHKMGRRGKRTPNQEGGSEWWGGDMKGKGVQGGGGGILGWLNLYQLTVNIHVIMEAYIW